MQTAVVQQMFRSRP